MVNTSTVPVDGLAPSSVTTYISRCNDDQVPVLHLWDWHLKVKQIVAYWTGSGNVCSLFGAMPLPEPIQCWLIANLPHGNRLQWNLNRNTNIFFHENAFQNVVCRMAAILFRPLSWSLMILALVDRYIGDDNYNVPEMMDTTTHTKTRSHLLHSSLSSLREPSVCCSDSLREHPV